MKVINNTTELFGDVLKNSLQSGSKLQIENNFIAKIIFY
jgi:hypothetical protein